MIDIEERATRAIANFKGGYNCSQSVVLAYSDITDLPEEQLAMITTPFGGGMGRLREVCGAVTGMFFVSGFCEKVSSPKDLDGKKRAYESVQRLAKEFRSMNGAIVCRELLSGETLKDKSATPEARSEEYYKKRPCAELVGDAARIVGRYLIEKNIGVSQNKQ